MRALVLLALALAAMARPTSANELLGTLKKVHDSEAIVLGYREQSLPFSFLNARGKPIGYSIDLCHEIIKEVRAELRLRSLNVKYVVVTPESRIPAVKNGEIDLECGSTTNDKLRQKEVAFSPTFFVAGTKFLVPRQSPIASHSDLRGKRVVVTAGTTNEAAIREINERQQLGIKIITARDHGASFALLVSGAADAFASDDVLLYGLAATAKEGANYKVVGDYLSYDPYGLMYRKDDPDFKAVVDRTFARLAESGKLRRLYDTWFQRRLPTGQTLGLPISPQLEEVFLALGAPN